MMFSPSKPEAIAISDRNPPARQVFSDPLLFLAFGFGSGLAPRAPGTFGTLAAVPLVALALLTPVWAYALLTLAVTLAGFPLCGRAADKLGVHDHGGIVWDEIAGLFVTAIPLLFLQAQPLWLGLLLAFVWFRVFDVLKPWPIRWLDRHVHGGLGIMLDDLLAGLFAAVATAATLTLLSGV